MEKTLIENLVAINEAKQSIKAAIIEKGGEVGNNITTYADAIRELSSGGGEEPTLKITNVTCSNGTTTLNPGDTLTIEFENPNNLKSESLDILLYGIGGHTFNLALNLRELGGIGEKFQMIGWGSNGSGPISRATLLYTPSGTPDNAVETRLAIVDTPSLKFYFLPSSYHIQHMYCSCYIKGTKITLADFTQKNVEDITQDDTLLCWNFDEGRFAFEKPFWIKKSQISNHFKKIVFEDSNEIILTGSNGNVHSLFDLETNQFKHANELLGHRVKTVFGETKVVNIEDLNIEDEFYNIFTYHHINLYANDLLTSSATYNNLYPIENMKFVYDEKYDNGYEFNGIPECYIDALRLRENKLPEEDIVNDIKMRINLNTIDTSDTENDLLVILKPGFEDKHDYVISEFNSLGWNFEKEIKAILTDSMCEVLWEDCLNDKYLYDNIQKYCKSGEVIIIHMKKTGCEFCDYKNVKTKKNEIRKNYKTDNIFANVIHTSDSNEDTNKELKLFF